MSRQLRQTRTALSITCAALIVSSLYSQTRTSEGGLRVVTRLVRLNVVVQDQLGDPVRSLSKDDFRILDGGIEQTTAFFSVVDNEQAISVGELHANEYLNSPILKGAQPSVTILLFDTLNAHWAAQGNGLERVRKFLRQIKPDDRIGIYVLGDELKVVHEYTHNASDIIAAVNRYEHKNSGSRQISAAPTDEAGTRESALDEFLSGRSNRYHSWLDERTLAGIGNPPNSAQRRAEAARAIQLTTASVEQIARELWSVPGRKSVVWISEDPGSLNYLVDDELDDFLQLWRKEPSVKAPTSTSAYQNKNNIERMIRVMNDAGIVVYTVDARGLETYDLGFRSQPNALPLASPTEPVNDLQARTPEPNLGLLELASRTGGRAFFNRNDIETGIRDALNDARFTYELGYYPDHNKWKGEWRKIQVKVNRPRVTVLARGGYFALPDPQPISDKNRYEFLSEVAASPIDSTQLPLSVHVGTSSDAKAPQIDVDVHMNPQWMLVQQADGRWKGAFEVVFIQIGQKKKLLDLIQKDVVADLDARQYGALLGKGWNLTAQLKFMKGANTLCVILRDKSSDAVGSVHVPLER